MIGQVDDDLKVHSCDPDASSQPGHCSGGAGRDNGAVRDRAVGSLTVDVASMSVVAVVLGLIRLGRLSLGVDESFGWVA